MTQSAHDSTEPARPTRTAGRLTGLLLVLTIAGLLTFQLWKPSENGDSTLIVAREEMSAGRLLVARRLLEEYLDHHPEDNEACLLLARAVAPRTPIRALELLARIESDRPEYLEAQRLTAELAVSHGLQETAEQALRIVVGSIPRDTSARVGLARILLQSRRSNEALPLLQQALEIEPRNVPAIILYAEALDDVGRATEMVDWLERSLELEPGNLSARANLAYACRASGRLKEAEREARSCLMRDPSLDEVRTVLAKVLYDNGRHNEARQEVQQVLSSSPNLLAAGLLEADMLLFEHRADEAYERLKPLEPQHAENRQFLSYLARAAQAAGHTIEAKAHRDSLRRMIDASRKPHSNE
ncbi:MAG: tetratricopeptide repeat protein [Planctomycetaceae bacterium]|nr:tetratricopeptide repeat protein [Planctomycetaceae bacterium]